MEREDTTIFFMGDIKFFLNYSGHEILRGRPVIPCGPSVWAQMLKILEKMPMA